MSLKDTVTQEFNRRFGRPPAMVVRAPGRVNLIGEHTDYNDGFVMPLAIDRAAWIALQPRDDDRVKVYSTDFDQEIDFSLSNFEKTDKGWGEYVKGVAWALKTDNFELNGWQGVLAGDVPMGSGLSSSAALEMAVARTFAAVSGFDLEPGKMARIGQHAENGWVGVNCGIMDQMISAGGRAGHALLIDCRDLSTRELPIPSGTMVVVLDTTTRRGLVASEYNVRRARCESAAKFFGVPALRDVSCAQFEARAHELTELERLRTRHVVFENARTLEAAEAMQADDAKHLGQLMVASHVSLRDDFEVSNAALNAIVECSLGAPGCFGARMTGAGFGGCAVALVDMDAEDAFIQRVGACYHAETGLKADIYPCHATNGAEVVA